MAFEIIGYTKDLRTDTDILYAQISIPEYLDLLKDNFDAFKVQRKQEGVKAYRQLKEDVKKGALLPAITLALEPDFLSKENHIEDIKKFIAEQKNVELVEYIKKNSATVFILDGLQRSFILKDLENENLEQLLLIEIWIEPQIEHLLYRFIVLNAGQKPISIRHRLEVLFYGLKKPLEKSIEGLSLISEKDEERVTQTGEFKLDWVATSYYCFLTKNFSLNKDTIVQEQMSEDKIRNLKSDALFEKYTEFEKYFKLYFQLNKKLENEILRKNFLKNEGIMNAFFGAVADFSSVSQENSESTEVSLTKLFQSPSSDDFLGIEKYETIKASFTSKTYNGNVQRRIFFLGFREFFTHKGAKNLATCWEFALKF